MKSPIDLITRLANGESISAVAENRQIVESYGLAVRETDGRIALEQAMELLDKQQIEKNIPLGLRSSLSLHWSIDSTNTHLMSKLTEDDFSGSVCLAERQTAGRGRRGKKWISPFGRNIYLSMAWVIPVQTGVAGLSLVVGMQIVKSLQSVGVKNLGLKWPNDVLLNGAKLAGILIELGAPEGDKQKVVIGIGINLLMSEQAAEEIDQPWSDAARYLNVSRNALVSLLITNLAAELDVFSSLGFSPYQSAWGDFDLYAEQLVCVHIGDELVEGQNKGVDSMGNLLLAQQDKLLTFNAGEVSLRVATAT